MSIFKKKKYPKNNLPQMIWGQQVERSTELVFLHPGGGIGH